MKVGSVNEQYLQRRKKWILPKGNKLGKRNMKLLFVVGSPYYLKFE